MYFMCAVSQLTFHLYEMEIMFYFISSINFVLGLTEIINDIEKGDYMKSLTPIPFSQSNEYLENALSPKSVESQTSCRSHDGVFLRPAEQQKKSLR